LPFSAHISDNIIQVVAALSAAYLSYYINDVIFQTSGVVAVSVTGLVTNAFGRSLINDHKLMGTYLGLMEQVLSTILFALGGVIWGVNVFSEFLFFGGLLLHPIFRELRKIESHISPPPFCRQPSTAITRVSKGTRMGLLVCPVFHRYYYSICSSRILLSDSLKHRGWFELEGGYISCLWRCSRFY